MSNFAFRGFTIFVMVLLLCGTALSEELQLPIQAHQVAIDIANRISGFDKLPNFSEFAITVQKIVVTEDDTALYQWIEGRSFWKVSYSGVIVEKDGERNLKRAKMLNCIETLEAESSKSIVVAATQLGYSFSR
ncbi:hypothetical protein FJZ31_33290 [Candidatus Poribacteria bacterium]|nr:hypothetical protein [Candidatus Poribacteria bacterium]